ncbi:MAG TPA: class I SAM-dependent rRNA methyltransferase [Aliicoccus persicus]|uniref:Class I SAM-dependent rRNA methyltransferase n=1 Tax=Aliicoccus persicus TaxID=930138 RepID=A0A921JB19_9STAP|nr:class I SAM-dependent rRNA methyltransferase [Aliicoccus persicus]
MERVQIKKGQENKYFKGQVNIEYGDLSDDVFLNNGQLISLESHYGEYIGTAILTMEAKAQGWVITRDANVVVDDYFVADLIQTAIDKRTALFNETGTNVFRLFNEIGDGLGGLMIDYYDHHLFVVYNTNGVYQYRDAIMRALIVALKPSSITEQTRVMSDGKLKTENNHVYGNVTFPIVVKETGIDYYAHLNDGPMTRLFIDQRETRKALSRMNKPGASMLNLFAYSGTFSIAAARAGMTTTSVDLAKRSIELIDDNFKLNGMDTERHNTHIMDTFEFLKYAVRNNMKYDVILIDPPSFARNKSKVFKVERDYPKLIAESVKVLKKNGLLILSQNLETFTLNQFKSQITSTLEKLGYESKIEDVKGLPKDFPVSKGYKNGKYLKVVTVSLNG